MATIKEMAMAYEPQTTLNIADLDRVSVDFEVRTSEEKTDKEGKPFTYLFISVNGKDYRIPPSVLEEIQTIMKLKPSVKFVRVKKSGSGLQTKYKVEALD